MQEEKNFSNKMKEEPLIQSDLEKNFLPNLNLTQVLSNSRLRTKLTKNVDKKVLNRRFERLEQVKIFFYQ